MMMRLLLLVVAATALVPPFSKEKIGEMVRMLAGPMAASFLAGAVSTVLFVDEYAPRGFGSMLESESTRRAGALFESTLGVIEREYVEKVDSERLFEIANEAMLSTLDPYTNYVKPDRVSNIMEASISGRYGGVGLVLAKTPDIVVVEAYENYAYEKGLRPGDKILRVGEVKSDDIDAVSKALRGVPGTFVEVEFRHPWSQRSEIVDLERFNVRRKELSSFLLDDNVAYVRLASFSRESAVDVDNALKKLGGKAVILDLRSNSGGLLESAVELATLFAPKNSVVVSVQGRGLDVDHLFLEKAVVSSIDGLPVFSTRINDKLFDCVSETTDDLAIFRGKPLALLVDGQTASAAEVVAAAVQDLDLGVLIGQKTYGKGLIQDIAALPFDAKLKITVGRYIAPSGRSIQKINYNGDVKKTEFFKTAHGRSVKSSDGIEPDIHVDPAIRLSPLETSLVLEGIYTRYFDILAQKKPDFAQDLFDQSQTTSLPSKNILSKTDLKDLELFIRHEANDGKITVNNEELATEQDIRRLFQRKGPKIQKVADAFLRERYFRPSSNLQIDLQDDNQLKSAINLLKDRTKYDAILQQQSQ